MKCLKERCRSPIACGSFGYCRERNQDGCPMDEANIARRRREAGNVDTSDIPEADEEWFRKAKLKRVRPLQ